MLTPPDEALCKVIQGPQKKTGQMQCGCYLIGASARQDVYTAAGWSFSPLFFTLFFPNAADETHSLFRIRKSIWLLESHPPGEYGTTQAKDLLLFCGWHQDYWLGCNTQDVET